MCKSHMSSQLIDTEQISSCTWEVFGEKGNGAMKKISNIRFVCCSTAAQQQFHHYKVVHECTSACGQCNVTSHLGVAKCSAVF